MLKVILASKLAFLLLGVSCSTYAQNSETCDLYYFLVNDSKGGFINPELLDSSLNMKDINPRNLLIPNSNYLLDLDSIFNPQQKLRFEELLEAKLGLKEIEKCNPNYETKDNLDNDLDSFSIPIVEKGINNCSYGFVVYSSNIPLSNSIGYRYYRKCNLKWELLYQQTMYIE